MGRRARLSSPLLLLVTLLAWLQRDVSAQQLASDKTLTPGPDSDSVCQRRSGGYYADLTSDCSSYTLCAPGGRPFHFACPPGTRFHQQYLVCDHEYRVDCPDSPRFYALNEDIGREQSAERAEPARDTGQEQTPQIQPAFANNRGGPPAPPLPPPKRPPPPERLATGRSIDSTPFSAPSPSSRPQSPFSAPPSSQSQPSRDQFGTSPSAQSPFSALISLAQSTRAQSQPAQARVQSPFSAQSPSSPRSQSPFSAPLQRAQPSISAPSPQAQSGSSPRAQSQPAPLRAESPRVQSPFNAPSFRASSPQAKSQFSAPSFQTESPQPAPPTADAGQTLLELLRFSTRESSQRPPARARQAPAAVEPRGESRSQPVGVSPEVPPGVPAILTRVAALGGSEPAPAILTRVAGLERTAPELEPVAPPRRPGLTQEAPLPQRTAPNALAGQRQAPRVTGTFFPARPEAPPRQQPRAGFNRVQRLNKSLSSPPARPGAALGAGRRGRWPLPSAGRRRARLGSGGGGGGWRTARRPAAGADPRCPRCLAALVTQWDNCFPCVSVLR